MNKIKIIAISGSTRKSSSNLNLIKAIAELTSDTTTMNIFEGLANIPHFNPDLDNDTPPTQVVDFRNQLRDANGILICTPEYAMGVPGTLKNAIDWTVSSMEFSKKPVALITASLSGEKGHQALLNTLLVIEAEMTADTQLIIPFIRTKVNDECKITNDDALKSVENLIKSFISLINKEESEILDAPILMNE